MDAMDIIHAQKTRRIQSEVAGSYLIRAVSRETPQGGVIIPMHWLKVVDKLYEYESEEVRFGKMLALI